MSFWQAVRCCLVGFADLRGRASRAECWWSFLFFASLSALATAADTVLFAHNEGIAAYPVALVCGFVTLLPFCSVTVRRLHDIGLSGWWFVGGATAVLMAMVAAWLMVLEFYDAWGTWSWLRFGGLTLLLSGGLLTEWYLAHQLVVQVCVDAPWVLAVLSFALTLELLFVVALSAPSVREHNRFGDLADHVKEKNRQRDQQLSIEEGGYTE